MSASAGTAVHANVVFADDAASFGAVNLDAVVGCATR